MTEKAATELKMIEIMADLRKDLLYHHAIEMISGVRYSDEESKAILIHLVISALGHTHDADYVLASWALLQGYDQGELGKAHGGLKKRREKMRNDFKVDRQISYDTFRNRENDGYTEIANQCFAVFQDRVQSSSFLESALVAYFDSEKAVAILPTAFMTRDKPSSTDAQITHNLSYVDGDDAGCHWGDSDGGRHVYTKRDVNSGVLGDSIVFNSITDGEFGDERNFVGAALIDSRESVWYGNQIEVEIGKKYAICLYISNDNPNGLRAIAESTRVSFSLPTTASESITVIGYIDSSNAKPERCWDCVTLHADRKIYIEYVKGSARYFNRGMGKIPLSDDIITSGTPIGYDRFDGRIPGGHGYQGVITIEVTTRSSVTARMLAKCRLKGTSYWTEPVYANIGDEIEFQIEYENLTDGIAKNVMIRDILPDNMEYVEGSTYLYNYSYQNGLKVDQNTVATTGINIGNYGARGNAYVRFTAKIVSDNLAKGMNQLVNWANVTVSGEVVGKCDVSILLTKRNVI